MLLLICIYSCDRRYTAEVGDANTKAAFKNCAPFTRCVAHINDEHVETAENLDIIMPMYNLLEYSENYADSSGSLYKFKRDEQNMKNRKIAVTKTDLISFKYKSRILGNLVADGANVVLKKCKDSRGFKISIQSF